VNVFVVGGYESELKQLVKLLKYRHARQAAEDIAVAWQELLPNLPPEVVVTHIPTTRQRERQRGFDQAQLLATAIAKQRALPHKTLLVRKAQTSQVGASRRQRLQQARLLFEPHQGTSPAGKVVLLVDDVITTGATMQSAAKLLRHSGAKAVIGLAIARQHLEKH